MDIKTNVEIMIKFFIYGFLLSGSLLITFTFGHLVKSAFSLLNKITK